MPREPQKQDKKSWYPRAVTPSLWTFAGRDELFTVVMHWRLEVFEQLYHALAPGGVRTTIPCIGAWRCSNNYTMHWRLEVFEQLYHALAPGGVRTTVPCTGTWRCSNNCTMHWRLEVFEQLYHALAPGGVRTTVPCTGGLEVFDTIAQIQTRIHNIFKTMVV